MQVFLAGLAGLAGVVLIITAVHGNGLHLYQGIFTTETNTTRDLVAPGTAAVTPRGPATVPGGPGAVVSA